MDTLAINEVTLEFSLLGPFGAKAFWTMMAFFLIGALIRKFIAWKKRNVKSDRSPVAHDWSFWVRDNAPDFGLGFLLAFVTVRWPMVIIEPLLESQFPTMPVDEALLLGCVLAGLGLDKISEMISKIAGLKK